MKFIDIEDGKSIRKDCIYLIEEIDEFTTKIHTEYGVFKVMISYKRIKLLLEADSDRLKQDKILEHLNVMSKSSQFFSG